MKVEVIWYSPKSKKLELVFAKQLYQVAAEDLVYRITHHLAWKELSELIEKHEGSKFGYMLTNYKENKEGYEIWISITCKT